MKRINVFLLVPFFVQFIGSALAQTPGTLKSYYRVDVAPGSILADSSSLWWYRGANGACLFPDADGDGIPEVMAVSRNFSQEKILHQLRMTSTGVVKPSPPNTNISLYPQGVWNKSSDLLAFGVNGSMAVMGDMNGNGVPELAVGNVGGGNGYNQGELFILFMNSAGKIDSLKQIRGNSLGFDTSLTDRDMFGSGVVNMGDLDGDGVSDVAVGASGAGNTRGMVWVVNLTSRGFVKSWKTIHNGSPNFPPLALSTYFGLHLANLGDLDRDGINDLMVGSSDSDARGSLWTLFMNGDGTVKKTVRYRPNTPAFPDTIAVQTGFGYSFDAIGDIDGDSVVDIALSQQLYKDSTNREIGRIYIWFMNPDGTIKGWQKIDRNNSNLGALADKVSFGYNVFHLGDFNKDGVPDVGVSIPDDDAAAPSNLGRNSGGFYILNLNGVAVTTSAGDIIKNESKDMLVYPNPAVDKLAIRSKNGGNKIIERLSVVNTLGDIVIQRAVNATAATLDIASLPPGSYVIQVQSSDATQFIQFIKH